MKTTFSRGLLIVVLAISIPGVAAEKRSRGYPISPVSFNSVEVHDPFWSPRLETNRAVTIPHVFRQCEQTGRIRNFEIADSVLAGLAPSGSFCSRYGFDDSDVFKSIEGAAYALHTRYDQRLDRYLDSLITKIGLAQEPDGYLYTMRTIKPDMSWAKERWVNDRTKSSHELYNVGHLYEAAAAHFMATGKTSLLDIARKNADLLVRTFGPEKMRTVPGHQVAEIGLVKLYLLTGTRAYLDLAKFFIDERGRGTPQGETYNQDNIPVLEQTEAVGHAVRAAYLYAGMADVAALTGDDGYVRAIDRIWEDVVWKKLYLTGGIGSAGDIEGFGAPYELPNLSAYCETCASIANVFWNFRMFLRHGDARYIDVLERVTYNGVLSGASLAGDSFFYPNPLESIQGKERTPWFTCACCPPNVARFIPSVPGYVYATDTSGVFVNLFLGSSAKVSMKGIAVSLAQETRYPWEGEVTISVNPATPVAFTLKVRIPGWARNQPLPGDLYQYQGEMQEKCWIEVNGKRQPLILDKGYAVIDRKWTKEDRVRLHLPMEVRRVVAHPKVQDDVGRVALERGPIVFCLEGADNRDGWVVNLVLPDTARLRTQFSADLLKGVQTIRGTAFGMRKGTGGGGDTADVQEFVAIPYYAWAHRGKSQMTVWPARLSSAARAKSVPSLVSLSKVSVSNGTGKDAVNDQFDPRTSDDHSVPYFHWWPRKGTTEWIQYDFAAPARVSGVEVYWFDDTGRGECRVPKSWRLLYMEGGMWKPVESPIAGPVVRNEFNTLSFVPVTTDAVRLEIDAQEGFAGGVHEWRIR